MKVLMTYLFAALMLIFSVASVEAKYVAIGNIEGQECTSYIVFSSCRFRRVDAVAADDGTLYTVLKEYDTVSDYRGNRCWINTASRGIGVLSWLSNKARQPIFYERQGDGEYEELDVDYITFPCEKHD